MNAQESFCLKFWPLAADVGMRYGINPATILAVGAQESGAGTSYSARNRRNYFGLRERAGWKVFATDAECFEYFGQLLARKYEAAALVSGNVSAFVKRMASTRYVSGSASEKALWGRNVVAYWRRFATLATLHGLRPSAPVLAETSTTVTRG
jgi:hypothetical protein